MSLFAAPGFGEVSVPGADGKSAKLAGIDDIIRHVTGKTSGQLSLEKKSLLLVTEHGGAVDSTVYRFDLDGSVKSVVEAQSSDVSGLTATGKDYPQGFPIVALPLETSTGTNVEMNALITPPYKSSDGKSAGRYLSITQHQDANKNVSLTAGHSSGQSLVECLNLSTMPLEVKNGITVSSSDIALSAVLVRDGAAATVYFVTLDVTPDKAAVRAISNKDGGLLSRSVTINKDVLPTMADGTPHFPVSMAVGDFDNDGYKNEVALAWSDIDHVNLEVLQLSFDGTQFSVGLMYSSTVYNYTYDNIRLGRDIGKNLDGVTSVYSTSVVAGDFDGDGRDEFAVVFRDNAPGDSRIYYNKYSRVGEGFPIIFDGLTGKVHTVTHKWDGSRFLTSEKIKNYASFTVDRYFPVYNIPLAVKAVAADVNGDGRDDIVPMIIRFDFDLVLVNDPFFDTFSLSGYVDWDVGASDSFGKIIFADVDADVDARGIGGGWNHDPFPRYPIVGYNPDPLTKHNPTFLRDPIRTTLTEGSTYYPYMEREFDIAAGEFTGRIGEVITVDDLVIKRPDGYEDVWVFDPDIGGLNWNKLKSAVSLVYNLDDCGEWYDKFGSNEWWYYSEGDMPKRWGKITQIASFPRDCAVGLVPGNYLGEGVKLGDPIKKTDTLDLDYIAILQMMPYHVDNVVSTDASYLTSDPFNFTLCEGTAVTYKNSSEESTASNLTYSMTASAETIFALDNPILRKASKSFQAIRGISTAVLGDSTKVSRGIEAAGKIWDKLKDTVTTTTDTSNNSATSCEIDLTVQANRQDTLYVSQSNRYLWRYPVLTYPVPDWLIGQLKDTTMESCDKSQVTKQQTYVTFAMSEPYMPATVEGGNDSHYQPYHEIGNLFSYPSTIEETEGYAGSTYMSSQEWPEQNDNKFKWSGPKISQTMNFKSSTTTQDKTKKVNKTGAITNFLSAVDNLAGTDLAKSPQDSDSSFTRNVTKYESLTVDIPGAFDGAKFSVIYRPYIDMAGTTNVAFAVYEFTDDIIWGGKNSLYRNKPDPSLLLPEKFQFQAKDDGGELSKGRFAANTEDKTALKMRGLRFYLADYGDMPVDSPLVKGLRYKIRVPVYNASFVDAKNFKVHLSYAKSYDYNAIRTQIGEYHFDLLRGWKSRSSASRQFAEFEWTADVDDGTYYLFADIDSEDKLPEIHENRRDPKTGNLIDVGGNNMGYFCVSVQTADSAIDDGTQSGNASVADGVMTAGSGSSAFPHIHWLKANGVDPDDFIRQEVLGADQPVSVEFHVGYDGDRIIPDALLLGYKLKAEAKGKTVREVTDRDIELYFLMEEFDLFPGENRKINFRMNPLYLRDGPECIRFAVKVAGTEYPVTDLGSSSHGGGCEVGFGALAVLAVLFGAASFVRKRR